MTKIGIVENDEKDMALLKNAIEEYYSKNGDRDFNLVCFPSALSFLNDTDKFDVAFLDIMMPHMDGMELAKKIRTTNNKMIIFLRLISSTLLSKVMKSRLWII